MDASDNELIDKIKKYILKWKLNAKTVSMTNPHGSNIKISNYIKIIDEEHVCFDPSRDF